MPQRAILSLILINIFINDLDNEAECTVCRFANDTKLGLGADTPEDCAPVPEGPWQAGEMTWQKPHKILQGNSGTSEC